ncbi:MAG TPA: thioredoxin family protein [Bacilli bacterium]|nr:thioredoxin family protein [Bacilli bacterium]
MKLVGTDTNNGMKLSKLVRQVVTGYDDTIKIQDLNDSTSINKYGITNTPALIIDGVIVSQGKTMSTQEIQEFLI